MEVNWLTSRESRGDCKEKKKTFKRTNGRQMQDKFRSKICQKKIAKVNFVDEGSIRLKT